MAVGINRKTDLERIIMKKRHTAEEISGILAEVGQRSAAGDTVERVCRELGVGPATYYAWQKRYSRMSAGQLVRLKELEAEVVRLRKTVTALSLDNSILHEVTQTMLNPEQNRQAVRHVRVALGVSERRACAALLQTRCAPNGPSQRQLKDQRLMESIRRVSHTHPRAGYRRIAGLLRLEGTSVTDKQVYRLRRMLQSPPDDNRIQ
jgi:putative transposase